MNNDNRTWPQINARRMKPYGEEPGSQIRFQSSDNRYDNGSKPLKMSKEEWRNMKRGPKKKARRKAKEDIKDQVENPHIGSTLVSLFDELGEREEFDKLCEKKRSA